MTLAPKAMKTNFLNRNRAVIQTLTTLSPAPIVSTPRASINRRAEFRRCGVRLALLASLGVVTATWPQTAQARSSLAVQRRANALVDEAARRYLDGQYSTSLLLCVQATQIAPDYPRAWVGLGKTQAALGQRDEAGRAYRQALKVGAQGIDASRAQNGLRALGLPLKEGRKPSPPAVPVRRIAPFKSWKPVAVITVSPEGANKSIAQAIKDAAPYSRIEIAAGTYHELLDIDKPLQIVGSKLGDVVIENTDAPCLLLRAEGATVSRLVFKANVSALGDNANTSTTNASTTNATTAGAPTTASATPTDDAPADDATTSGVSGNRFHAVEISSGRSLLSNCEVQTQSRVGISVYGAKTFPLISRCKVMGARTSGIIVYNRARADIDTCDMAGASFAGLEVFNAGNVFAVNCTIHDNRTGVIAATTATILLQNCTIEKNVWQGVRVEPYGNLYLRRTKVQNNAHNISLGTAGRFLRTR